MNGAELLRLITRLGRARGAMVRYDAQRGKGSHGTLYFDGRRTTLKDPKKEIGPGLLRKMLTDLGLSPRDLENR
jgi:mRNA interferase HicA